MTVTPPIGHPPAGEAPSESAADRVEAARPASQPRNPLHGLTLEAIVRSLVDHLGWEALGQRIPIRCFNLDPSITSSLRFLRKTPWAREKVEGLYLLIERDKRRHTRRADS